MNHTKLSMRIVFILTVSTILFFLESCKRLTLNNDEAKQLVTKTLGLPQKYVQTVNANDNLNNASDLLEQEGYVTKSGSWIYGYTLNSTDLGSEYIDNVGKEPMYGKNTITFKTLEIDFGEITGVSLNEDNQTATVRFSLKAINITPVGKILCSKIIDNSKNGELIFKKFESEWQLENLTKSSQELVKNIVLTSRN